MPYISTDAASAWIASGSVSGGNKLDPVVAEAAALSACSSIDTHCRRMFDEIGAGAASEREFAPWGDLLVVDDISSTSGLVVEIGSTAYSLSDLLLYPLNSVGPDGRSGWPYTQIRFKDGRTWPVSSTDPTVTVTAKWGWTTTPTNVKLAAKILANDLYGMKDIRFGAAGFGEYGLIRLRENGTVVSLLEPYVRKELKIGLA